MKILNISGGGTGIAGELGAIESILDSGFKPDVVTGISAGSILALALAVGIIRDIKGKILSLKLTDFFVDPPITIKGTPSLTAIWRLITGKKGLGDFSQLETLLKEYITREKFNAWKRDKNSMDAYIGTVSYTSGQKKLWNLKEMDYEIAIRAVRASASIPVFCEPVKLFDDKSQKYEYHLDGGVRNYTASQKMIKKFKSSISEMVNVYAKPADNKIFEFDYERTNSIIPTFSATMSMFVLEVSKSDEIYNDLAAEKYDIKITDIYIPLNLSHAYDVDPTTLKRLYISGKQISTDTLNNGIPKK